MAHIDLDRPVPLSYAPYLHLLRPKPTGNILVVLRQEAASTQLKILERAAREASQDSTMVAHAVSTAGMSEIDTLSIEEPILLGKYGIGLLPGKGVHLGAMAHTIAGQEGVEEARPEFFMFSLGLPASDSGEQTWGVEAVGAHESPFSGRGIRIAILDTGLDAGHPDFQGRTIVTRNFIPQTGESTNDVRGHGTHCAGTAAARRPGDNTPRYGIAPDVDLFIGKVLNDAGTGAETDILAGMEWAIEEKCAVISMSLGRPVQPREIYSRAYERLGAAALDAGLAIFAAAGNNSSRQFGFIAPVTAPANSPSIVAVAAVDPSGEVADFSCSAVNPDGGEIDIAGPGVGVFSSYPLPQSYRSLSGTSMACPHVAGLAALWAESDPKLRGRSLVERLKTTALALNGNKGDTGGGLAQAPNNAVA